jgi:hypothetical protein
VANDPPEGQDLALVGAAAVEIRQDRIRETPEVVIAHRHGVIVGERQVACNRRWTLNVRAVALRRADYAVRGASP